MAHLILEKQTGVAGAFELRGGALKLWRCKDQEAMLSGPAETGKTIASLLKLHISMIKYPGAQGAIVRQTYKSLAGTVLKSFDKKVLGKLYKTVVKPYGGEKPEWYDYPNGSRIWLVGMDTPDKILSAELDIVYVNQAEEIELSAWEYLLTRTTGRAGNMPYAILYGDCNPGAQTHWIKRRFRSRLMESRHEDNPSLFDSEGKLTEQGVKSMAALDALTGVRKQRLRYGRWVSAEGAIYEEFDRVLNVCTRAEVPKCNRFIEVVDFGFKNPFVWQRWAIDHDGRVYITHELYMTEILVEDACKLINRATAGLKRCEATICDHDAEDRATYERYRRCTTIAAEKEVLPGIEDVKKRMPKQKDGKVRFKVCSDASIKDDQKLIDAFKPQCGLDEVDGYVWDTKTTNGRLSEKDTPLKEWDHAMDNWRYGCRFLDKERAPGRRPESQSYGSM